MTGRQIGRGAGGGRGELRGGDVPTRRKGGSFRVGLRDGERGRGFFFFFLVFFLPLRLSRCPYMGKPLSGVGEQYCYRHWYVD